MRISDWSSDVCSSDLQWHRSQSLRRRGCGNRNGQSRIRIFRRIEEQGRHLDLRSARPMADRKSVVSGKSVSVRVDTGGRRILKKKTTNERLNLDHTQD